MHEVNRGTKVKHLPGKSSFVELVRNHNLAGCHCLLHTAESIDGRREVDLNLRSDEVSAALPVAPPTVGAAASTANKQSTALLQVRVAAVRPTLFWLLLS